MAKLTPVEQKEFIELQMSTWKERLYKLIDAGLIPEDFDGYHLKVLISELTKPGFMSQLARKERNRVKRIIRDNELLEKF